MSFLKNKGCAEGVYFSGVLTVVELSADESFILCAPDIKTLESEFIIRTAKKFNPELTQQVAIFQEESIKNANKSTADEVRLIVSQRNSLLTICEELAESAAYWSEYDVPLGIVDRLNTAIAKAKGGAA